MTLNIFTISNILSRNKQQFGKIGEIECLDTNNDSSQLNKSFTRRSNDLYVGTVDGFVHKFRLREKSKDESQTAEKRNYECLCIGSQSLETRKSIVKLKAISVTLRRIIALTDNLLVILDSDNLRLIPNLKLKHVVTFAVSTGSDSQTISSIDFCVSTKRNKLQVYRLDNVNINPLYEIPMPDCLISIVMDGNDIIGCSESKYYAYSGSNSNSNDRRSNTSALLEIFSLDDPKIMSCLTDISPGEYLLNGPNMGIATSLQGVSQRAPIVFDNSPMNFIYSHPYLIVLVPDTILIYSYLDNELKQQIPFKQCRTLTPLQYDSSRSILITTRTEIHLLEPLSLEEQIDQLLHAFRLQEALNLAESSCTSIKQRQTNPLVVSTKKRISLIEFAAMNVKRALPLFEEIRIDFHEIIGQIPGFVPVYSLWPEFDETQTIQYNKWLETFCEYMEKSEKNFSHHPDYYSSLIKAYVVTRTREMLVEFIENAREKIPVESVELLVHGKFYHAAALLYSIHGKHSETIGIWQKLVLNEYSNDETFPGVWMIAKYVLERNIDRSLEFSTAEWLLEQNEEELALKIFTSKHKNESTSDLFCTSRVAQRLKNHVSALTNYLEHVVFKMKIETDEIHTRLVNIYLDEILSQSDETNHETRSKLQSFIITSDSYRIQSVLNRVNQTNRLRREVALLHGKMNQFEQAFRILINELNDFEYAENYCVVLSKEKSIEDRRTVAHILFKVLLNSLNSRSEDVRNALLRLLCNSEIDFDFIEVLQRLPPDWSLGSLAQILVRALRTCSYTQREKKIECALSRVRNQNLMIKFSRLKSGHTIVNEYRRCKHCLQQFYESSCVVYQDGSQVHVHCSKQYQSNQQLL